jgi:hypothetical protein
MARWAVAGAILVHAALLVALATLPAPDRNAPPPPVAPVAIELFDAPEPAPGAVPAAATAPTSEASESSESLARASTRGAPAESRETRVAPKPGGASGRAPEGAPPAFSGVTMGAAPVSSAAIGLELGAPNRFAGTRAEGPARAPEGDDARGPRPRTRAETKRAVEQALREPARQRERELGLGPEGPVLKALGDAASAGTAPVTGRAVFLAVADATGMIIGIEVVACDGGRSGWSEAAALARAALKGKKLRLPSTAQRAEMRIEITSAWKMPSGHDPGADVSLFGLPVAKGEGKQATKISILDPIPKLHMVELAPDIKVPVVSVNVDVLSVAGDPADIGARPRRIVHARLIDSKVM